MRVERSVSAFDMCGFLGSGETNHTTQSINRFDKKCTSQKERRGKVGEKEHARENVGWRDAGCKSWAKCYEVRWIYIIDTEFCVHYEKFFFLVLGFTKMYFRLGDTRNMHHDGYATHLASGKERISSSCLYQSRACRAGDRYVFRR